VHFVIVSYFLKRLFHEISTSWVSFVKTPFMEPYSFNPKVCRTNFILGSRTKVLICILVNYECLTNTFLWNRLAEKSKIKNLVTKSLNATSTLCVESQCTVAKFIVPDCGDKVNSDIGLSYRPARLYMCWRSVRQPYAGVNYFPQSGTMNLATELHCLHVPSGLGDAGTRTLSQVLGSQVTSVILMFM